MSTRLKKTFRDFTLERTRTAFVVAAITIGITAFSTVLSAHAILVRELDQGYLATNPASAEFKTDEVDDALLNAVASTPGVGGVEAGRILAGRIKVGPAEWRNLQLFVVRDFRNNRIDKLQPEQGALPPAAGEVLIERDAFQVARARIGDTVTVRIGQGDEKHLRISGGVHDVGKAQARMENVVYGYVTPDTLSLLGEKPYLDRMSIVVAENMFDEAHVRAVAAEVGKTIESQGRPLQKTDVPEPGKHPHSAIMGLLLLSMAGFGFFALALSGILLVNLMAAVMAAQVRQIGVMKAVGGGRRQIASIYLGQALLLGVVAVVLAQPLGILGGRILCRYLAIFLNFDINSFAVPVRVYLLTALVGLAVPVLAALRPVWKGAGISVHAALADYGVSQQAFGTTGFDRAVAGLGGMTRPVLLAVRNGFRRRARVALTLVTLTLSGLFFLTALNVKASLVNTLDRLFETKRFDLTLSLGTLQPFEKIERAVRNTHGVLRAEGWIASEGTIPSSDPAPEAGRSGGLHGGGGAGGGHGSGAPVTDRFSVVGLPAETSMFKPNLIAGRGLQPNETDTVVVNSALASKGKGLKVGDAVVLQIGPSRETWRVVGIAAEPFSPSVAYVPKLFYEQAGRHEGMTNSVRLVLTKNDSATINAVKADLERNLEAEGIRALNCSSKGDGRYGFDQHMVMIYVFLIIMACILAGVGGLGLATSMSLNVMERRREMGILRAIGAAPRVVWLIVVTEGVVVSLLGWAAAGLAAFPVGKIVGDFLVRAMFRGGVDFRFDPAGPLVWLAVSILLGAAASFLPAWRASRLSVREAVGYE